MVTSGERWDGIQWPLVSTVNSQLLTSVDVADHRVKGHFPQPTYAAHVLAGGIGRRASGSANLPSGRPAARAEESAYGVLLQRSGGLWGVGEALGGRAHVLVDDLQRGGHIATLNGIDDRGVPVPRHHRRLPRRAVEDGDPHAPFKVLPRIHKHGVARQSAQLEMERQVRLDPRREILTLVNKLLERSAKPTDGRRPSRGRDDLADRQPLQSRANLEELADLNGRQAVDPQHPTIARGDQPLLLEMP
jgi:hypothetical protein